MSWDLDSLRLLAWALLLVVFTVTTLSEGLNLGTAFILALSVKDDDALAAIARRIAMPSLLNLLWLSSLLVTVFAGWPTVFAVAVSSFAPLLWLLLAGVMLRQMLWMTIDVLRSCQWWPKILWLWRVSSVLNVVMVGIILAGVLKGVPFHLDSDVRILFLGDVWGLFNLFSGLFAATCVAALAAFGAALLRYYDIEVAGGYLIKSLLAFLLLFAVVGWWLNHLEGYHISSELLSNVASNPISKFVKRGEGLWLDNYEHETWLMLLPILSALAALVAGFFVWRQRYDYVLLSAAVLIASATLTLGITLFPFLLPSNLSLNSAMTLWDCSASFDTLKVMVPILAVMLLPMVLLTRLAWRD